MKILAILLVTLVALSPLAPAPAATTQTWPPVFDPCLGCRVAE